MATYTTVGPEGKIIAKLEMNSWLKPPLWNDEGPIPEYWPAAEIDSLCRLFMGSVPSERGQEGMFIKDILGRHIAVMMAQWSNQEVTFHSQNTRTNHIERARAISQIIGQWYATGVAIHNGTRI